MHPAHRARCRDAAPVLACELRPLFARELQEVVMSSYYRPYFERERGDRDLGWERRRQERRRHGFGDDDLERGFRDFRGREPYDFDEPGESAYGRGRFDQFEDWERPRELDQRRRSFGRYTGRGPKGYQRSDERIKEEVCDRLTVDPDVDAFEIEVSVQDGEVTLEGAVPDRRMKRDAEDCVELISGVREIHNRIRVGGARAADTRAADPSRESEERENLSGVSRFWRGGH
jgi:BON domain